MHFLGRSFTKRPVYRNKIWGTSVAYRQTPLTRVAPPIRVFIRQCREWEKRSAIEPVILKRCHTRTPIIYEGISPSIREHYENLYHIFLRPLSLGAKSFTRGSIETFKTSRRPPTKNYSRAAQGVDSATSAHMVLNVPNRTLRQ